MSIFVSLQPKNERLYIFMQKIRNFACLLYTESISENWLDLIRTFGVPCYYVLHDKDDKKSHIHVIFCAENAISVDTAQMIIENIGGANGKMERVANRKGYLRYLIHLDNPEKYQYKPEDVHTECGAIYDLEKLASDEELLETNFIRLQEILEYIDASETYIYCDFVRYCMANRRDWLKILISPYGRIIDKYIKSFYWATKNNEWERK